MKPSKLFSLAAPISGAQYSIIRFIFGFYLLIHFVQLIPYGSELFSASGIFPHHQSPLMGILPNPLAMWDTPTMVNGLLYFGAICALMLTIGLGERFAALASASILAWLFARNPLIANPSLPVVGWMLIMIAFIPKGVYGAWHAREQAFAWQQWRFPIGFWFAAWIMLSVAYTYSGYTKFLSPSWVDGTAIEKVLNNPLARDHFLREWLLALPSMLLRWLTWAVMWIEFLFIPMALFRKTRILAWTILLLVQFGFLTFLNFADLTFPMLVIHALTFDRGWLVRSTKNTVEMNNPTLYFDGYCAFCNGFVRFVLAEDQRHELRVAPLDHPSNHYTLTNMSDTIILVDGQGVVHYKSDAVIATLNSMGGIWPIFASIMTAIPSPIRDAIYDATGRIRYLIAGRTEVSCQRLPKTYQSKLLT